MTGITTYLSVLTLNVNELNSPIKRQQSVAYRRLISSTETSTGLGLKAERRFSKLMALENRQE
jgi:hypothetical protein